MSLELSHIDYNEEDMKALIRTLNDRMDSIVLAFNSLEVDGGASTASSEIETPLDTVRKRIRAKNIKFGTSNITGVKDNTLFVDDADGVLKYKDVGGTVRIVSVA